MNIKQILCHVKTLGNHVEFRPTVDADGISFILDDIDCHCVDCNYYLYSTYDFKASLKKMRNDMKMWWETPE